VNTLKAVVPFLTAASAVSIAQTSIPPMPPTNCDSLAYYTTINGYWGSGPTYGASSCKWSASTSVSSCPSGPGVCNCPNPTDCYADARVDSVDCTNVVQPNPLLPMDSGCMNTPGPVWESSFVGSDCDGPPAPPSNKLNVSHEDQLRDDGAERDLPRPAPFSNFKIVDVGQPESPVKIYGTGYAYIKKFSTGSVMTWVEGLDLRVQNISPKTITAMDLEPMPRPPPRRIGLPQLLTFPSLLINIHLAARGV
jgi:hypothetical protein